MDFLKGLGIIVGFIGYLFVFNWVWYKVSGKWMNEDANDMGKLLVPIVFPVLIPMVIVMLIAAIVMIGREFG